MTLEVNTFSYRFRAANGTGVGLLERAATLRGLIGPVLPLNAVTREALEWLLLDRLNVLWIDDLSDAEAYDERDGGGGGARRTAYVVGIIGLDVGVIIGEAGLDRGVDDPLVSWALLREGRGGGDRMELRAELGGEGR